MNKFLSVLVIIIGGIMMVVSMTFWIITMAKTSYLDIKEFPINFTEKNKDLKTEIFALTRINGSVWLRTPNRAIENEDIKIEGTIEKDTGEILASFNEDFNFGYYRIIPRTDEIFYKLGGYNFQDKFKGYLKYKIAGAWTPDFKGSLVIKEKQPFLFQPQKIAIFLIGIIVLVFGILSVKYNYKINHG